MNALLMLCTADGRCRVFVRRLGGGNLQNTRWNGMKHTDSAKRSLCRASALVRGTASGTCVALVRNARHPSG